MSKLYIKNLSFVLTDEIVDQNGVARFQGKVVVPEITSPYRIIKAASCIYECYINYAGDVGNKVLTVSYGIFSTAVSASNEVTVSAWVRGVSDRQFTYVLPTSYYQESSFKANVYVLSDQ